MELPIQSPTSDLPTDNVAIIGTGFMGRALAEHIGKFTNYSVTLTSRSKAPSPAEAVKNASVVILAIPAAAHSAVLADISPNLTSGCLLIDISNSPLSLLRRNENSSNSSGLISLVPENVHVIKAFNTLSPQRLMLLPPSGGTGIPVPYACNKDVSKRVACFISDLTFVPRYFGSLEQSAGSIESLPHTLFPHYTYPIILSIIIWAWWILYSILAITMNHEHLEDLSSRWTKAPLVVYTMSTGETGMTLFAITFLAGPVARLWQLLRGSVSKPFPYWFAKWLDARKELGLIAFVYSSAHAFAGAVSASGLDHRLKGQLYSVFGITSYMTFALLALCSGTATSNTLSWAEFRAVFSWLGVVGLVFGVLHHSIWGWLIDKYYSDQGFWVGNGKIVSAWRLRSSQTMNRRPSSE